MVPSLDTSAPGNLFTRASIVEPSGTRYAEALYWKVSAFTTTFGALATTFTSFKVRESTWKSN